MFDGLAGLKLTLPIVTTLGTALLLLLAGAALLRAPRDTKRADIGTSLLVGSAFLLAAGLTQLTVDASNFRASVALANDLTGFDPDGRSLHEYTLAAKTLRAAQLDDADLTGANLAYADLQEANLGGADAEGASFFYARLYLANLSDADLRNANLAGAEVATPYLDQALLTGARVHKETCWQIALDAGAVFPRATPEAETRLERIVGSGLVSSDATLGHVCTREEGSPDYPAIPDRAYLCAVEPYLRIDECSAR